LVCSNNKQIKRRNKTRTIKEFTIDFDKWGQGYLVAPTGDASVKAGHMCCLGFLGKACGVPKTRMEAHGLPFDLNLSDLDRFPILGDDIFYELVAINDGGEFEGTKFTKLNKTRRMIKITKIFAQHGITAKWKNVPRERRREFVSAVGKKHLAV
jgi:hypothetical protein